MECRFDGRGADETAFRERSIAHRIGPTDATIGFDQSRAETYLRPPATVIRLGRRAAREPAGSPRQTRRRRGTESRRQSRSKIVPGRRDPREPPRRRASSTIGKPGTSHDRATVRNLEPAPPWRTAFRLTCPSMGRTWRLSDRSSDHIHNRTRNRPPHKHPLGRRRRDRQHRDTSTRATTVANAPAITSPIATRSFVVAA